jgi:hypothetical protein
MHCRCPARLKPDLLCVQGLPYQGNPPTAPDRNITIQFIEFTYCNDRFSHESITTKMNKYQPPLDALQAQNWTVALYWYSLLEPEHPHMLQPCSFHMINSKSPTPPSSKHASKLITLQFITPCPYYYTNAT